MRQLGPIHCGLVSMRHTVAALNVNMQYALSVTGPKKMSVTGPKGHSAIKGSDAID